MDQKKNRLSLDLHQHQHDVFYDKTRNHFILAGRRGGKTKLVTERLIQKIYECPPFGDVFYIGPTLQDATDIIWEPLRDRLDHLRWKHNALISKRRFEFSGHRKLYIIGAEKIRRIRGHSVYFAALDEVAYYSTSLKEVWLSVRPALSDLKGGSMVTTTPNGKGTEAYDFYLEVLDKPEWKYFYWRTIDNPWIDPKEVEAAKRELDEKSFRQEYEATWEAFEGLAYYNFNENVHIKKCQEIDGTLPIDISFDFNVNPTTLLVSQFKSGRVQVKKEYSFKDSSTERTIKAFCEDFKAFKGTQRIRVFGDAAGLSRSSTTGFSDYHYVKECLTREEYTFEMCVMGFNPPIIDRVMTVNAWLKNYHGESRVDIDPSCRDLLRDLSSQELEGRMPSPKNNLGHKGDSFGYHLNWLTKITDRKKQGTTVL